MQDDVSLVIDIIKMEIIDLGGLFGFVVKLLIINI